MKKIVKFAGLSLAAAALLAACAPKSADQAAGGDKVLKVGVMTMTESDQARWDAIQEGLKAEGITLEFTEFTEYPQVNPALANGEVDINAFQHYNYLDNHNKETGDDLAVVAETYISPINLFPGTDGDGGKAKYKAVSEIPDKATIAIPNDVTNESRALYVLEAVGLIKLDVSGTELATLANIKENKKNLDIKEVEASQLPAALSSVDAAIINNSFAVPAGIDYATSLYREESSNEAAKQWINIIAAQKDWESSDKADLIKALVKAYHTDEVKAIIEETSNNVDVPVW